MLAFYLKTSATATASEHYAWKLACKTQGLSVYGCSKRTGLACHQVAQHADAADVLLASCRYHPSLLQFQGAAWSVQQMPKAGSRDSSNINDTANRQAGGTASSGSMPEGCELVYQLGVAHLQRLSDIDTARSVALARELNTAVATAASKAAVRAVAEGTFAAATCSSPSQTSHTAAGAVQEQEQQQVGQRAFHNLPGGATHVWQVALPVGDALGRLDPAKVLSVRHWEHPAHTGGCTWGEARSWQACLLQYHC
jgi:hypothetical protein